MMGCLGSSKFPWNGLWMSDFYLPFLSLGSYEGLSKYNFFFNYDTSDYRIMLI